ncbi:hypothetical protein V8C42DRAFT_309718 [Trichoderma barbatum]
MLDSVKSIFFFGWSPSMAALVASWLFSHNNVWFLSSPPLEGKFCLLLYRAPTVFHLAPGCSMREPWHWHAASCFCCEALCEFGLSAEPRLEHGVLRTCQQSVCLAYLM